MPRATTEPEPGDSNSTPRHKRTYRACLACRTAKLRCDLGSVDAPSAPPCRRCRRTGRPCQFSESYQRAGAGASGARYDGAGGETGETGVSQPQPHPQEPVPVPSLRHVGSSASRSPGRKLMWSSIHDPPLVSPPLPPPGAAPAPARPRVTEPHLRGDGPLRLDFVYGRNLETPADALRLLCSVAGDNRAAEEQPATPEAPAGGDVWIRWPPVREGLLTSTEAALLVQLYARAINPCHPLVPIQLFEAENISLLLQEPLLVSALTCVAARYADLGQSFDPREPSRARIVEKRLTEWILKRISYVAMGSAHLRTIGTVEAMLILSEWPPRAMLLEDTSFLSPEEQGNKSNASACKHQDDVAWNLVGLAVRIAQGLALQDESTYMSQDWSSWRCLRRLNTWINCLSADRHVSGRLGRTSLTPTTMWTSWWEMFFFMSFESSDDSSFPLPRSRRDWRHSRVGAEHAHIIGICHEMLYPNPSVTADLIKTGRYQSILTRLKPELDYLWQWLVGDMRSADGPSEEFRQSGIDPELQELMWRVDFDYVRLYANAIAMRAAVTRILRQNFSRDPEARQRSRNHRLSTLTSISERMMDSVMMSAVEGVQVLEAVESAIALLKHGIECHRRGVLRYCPGRTFQRIMFATVFLMKAMSVGAVSEKEPEILELQHRMIVCFREAAVDDDHISSEIANLLGRVFPAFPAVPAQVHLEAALDPTLTAGAGAGACAGADPQPPVAPIPQPDMPASLGQADLFANWGFDPVLILAEMDDFIQAVDSSQDQGE